MKKTAVEPFNSNPFFEADKEWSHVISPRMTSFFDPLLPIIKTINHKSTTSKLGIPKKMTSEAPENPSSQPATQNGQAEQQEIPDGPNPPPELPSGQDRLPTRKDTSLREFLNKIDDCAPIVSRSQTRAPPPKSIAAGD